MANKVHRSNLEKLKNKLYVIIFEADTTGGKNFDVALLIIIFASVLLVMLETVPFLYENYADTFLRLEWGFTVMFTVEYLLRIFCVKKPWGYIKSGWGIIDLLAILPAYLSIIFSGSNYLIVVRALRLLRVFRIFKLTKFIKEGILLLAALRASRMKILVFLLFILIAVINIGALMYLVEGGVNQNFSSIPISVYWAIVTLTTVGYGDISPVTDIGRFLASIVMILGYSVLAVPTGIISSEIIQQQKGPLPKNTQVCSSCLKGNHDDDADYCKYCGEKLH